MTGAEAWLSAEEARQWAQGLWIVLVIVWVVGAFMTRQTARQQTSSSRIWQMGIVLLGMWLLFGRGTGIAWMDRAAFPVTLGANWSGVVTVKEGHTLVRRGPYRIVRHPIYTGLLAAVAGTALTHGSVHSVLALPIVASGFWLKTLTEERFMVQQFGEEYLRYKHEVRALFPFVF
jgi:protein-S-isoprenylcysteine O-methyltransferase Ste14